MISAHISRASAVFLGLVAVGLIFASDAIVPRLIPGFPSGGAWLGQLLGAAWFAVATLNWLSGATLLGGIYGRPLVLTNATLYFIATMVLVKIVWHNGSVALWTLFVPIALLCGAYVWLLFRG
ncbi:MAG TPA: hypothetical protein VK636_21395, partial [Gemmatimonadaceae bacterium]|nr:hypothetical protein [Gemmatimonadaceae bacterium]